MSTPPTLPMSTFVELEAAAAKPEDYDDRAGYQAAFLGEGASFVVALPLPGDQSDLVPVDRAKAGRPFELCYTHFSVAMSKKRRLCWITAVNIDGGQPFFKPKRPGWRTDPRIPTELQVGKEFYVPTEFDRGHMVRRLDPVWGEQADAFQANDDTHHYTNSCPQIHSFNDVTWGDLEDWVLQQEQTRDSKASVFTGPVFSADDPVHQEVKVPVEFFKMIVVVDDATSELSATAFIMSQSDVMPEGAVPEAAFDPGQFTVNQITLADLAQKTGLNFDALLPFDVLAAHPQPESTVEKPPLRSARDAVLWKPRK